MTEQSRANGKATEAQAAAPGARPLLFTPLRIRTTEFKNRIVVSPMCQYLAVEGHVQDWHFAHHARFALGGAGCVFVEATAVARDGRITYGCTGIWDDSHVAGLSRIARLHRTYGALSGIQIGHSGRRGSAAVPWDGAKPLEPDGADEPWQTVAPSPVPERQGHPVPRELSVAEIEDIIGQFVAAARRADAAGFDVLQLHGAHGYLLHSFFSPVSNRRTDAFGGDRERRMRVPLLVTEAVRKVWPEGKPLFYRVSAVDGVEGGLEIGDTVALARALKPAGVDVIDCSSGGMAGPATMSTRKISPGYQVPYAEAVRRGAEIATMAVGAILDGPQAEAILTGAQADLIAVGREMLADPNWSYRAALDLNLDNPHAVLTQQYAFYLERRAAVLER